jgi:hypothetical protein
VLSKKTHSKEIKESFPRVSRNENEMMDGYRTYREIERCRANGTSVGSSFDSDKWKDMKVSQSYDVRPKKTY